MKSTIGDWTTKNVGNIIAKSFLFKRIEGTTKGEYIQQIVLGVILWLIIGTGTIAILQLCGVL